MTEQNNEESEGLSDTNAESYPDLVIASGNGLSSGLSNHPNEFQLDARKAGFGDFDVVVKGASRALIEYIEEEDALYNIKYNVTLAGEYSIEIKFDMKDIPGSPFCAKVTTPPPPIQETNQLPVSSPTPSFDSFSTLHDSSDEDGSLLQKLPLEANVQSPSGKSLVGSVFKTAKGKVSVKFPKIEVGTYIVTMKHKLTGNILKGSPYTVVVCPNKQRPALIASGDGLRTFNINKSNHFCLSGIIDINDISIIIVGSLAADINVTQNVSDSLDIVYEVKRGGKYVIHVNNKGIPITGSPFEVCATECPTEQNALIQKRNLQSTVRITTWHGRDMRTEKLTSELRALSGQYLAHLVVHRGRYILDISFLPLRNDQYELTFSYVNDNTTEQKVPVTVDYLPEGRELFIISGEGIYGGTINKPSSIFVDSLLPESKSFSVAFDGPDRIDILQCHSKDNKLCIVYIARTPGNYKTTIKYDGFHIPDTPLIIKINSSDDGGEAPLPIAGSEGSVLKSDPSLCRAYGEGLKSAVVGISSSFNVNALNAGSGDLMAGFISNKSSETEVMCKHLGDCLYNVDYKIGEPGVYNLAVLWANSHITGSPFQIKVSDIE